MSCTSHGGRKLNEFVHAGLVFGEAAKLQRDQTVKMASNFYINNKSSISLSELAQHVAPALQSVQLKGAQVVSQTFTPHATQPLHQQDQHPRPQPSRSSPPEAAKTAPDAASKPAGASAAKAASSVGADAARPAAAATAASSPASESAVGGAERKFNPRVSAVPSSSFGRAVSLAGLATR